MGRYSHILLAFKADATIKQPKSFSAVATGSWIVAASDTESGINYFGSPWPRDTSSPEKQVGNGGATNVP